MKIKEETIADITRQRWNRLPHPLFQYLIAIKPIKPLNGIKEMYALPIINDHFGIQLFIGQSFK